MPPRAPPWAESPTRVIVEFKKQSGAVHRYINLSHGSGHMPQQLVGRVPPEVWSSLIQDMQYLASIHPFCYQPEEGTCWAWCGGYCCILCLSIGRAIGDDHIEYQNWVHEVNVCLQAHQHKFAQYGAILSLTGVQMSQWVQIDLAPIDQLPHQPGGYPMALGPVMMCAPMMAGPVGPMGPF